MFQPTRLLWKRAPPASKCGGGQGAEGPSAKDVGLLVGRLLQGESFVGSSRFYPYTVKDGIM